jgi:hypothetical protein
MSTSDHFADRVWSDPQFLAARISTYQALRDLSDTALCGELGITADALTRLRLCGVPRSREGVEAIAERFGMSAEALARITGPTGH